jgi:ribonuclease Z
MTPEMGTKHAVEHFLQANNWDYQTRAYKITPVPGSITVHEFDYKGVNEVVYQENGVTVRSLPAIHAGDGPVSFILEYSGLKIVFGGDTSPNKWFVKHAKGADLVIHEVFPPPRVFIEFGNQPPQFAWRACCEFHTSGPAFGKIMSEVKPRHAVGYHFLNEEATRYAVYDGIRQTYGGPLSMATDRMARNVTKDSITERMAVAPANSWAVPGTTRQPPPERGRPDPMSDFIKSGDWVPAFKAQNELLDEHMKKYGLEDQDWRKQKPWYEPR